MKTTRFAALLAIWRIVNEAPMGFGLLSMKLYLIVRFLLDRQQKIEYF
jgi:hypothetical protein